MVKRFTLKVDGISHDITVEGNAIWVDGKRYLLRRKGSTFHINGVGYEVSIQGEMAVVNGQIHTISMLEEPATPSEGSTPEETPDGHIRAIMPGKVVAIRAREGDKIQQGAVVLVLEAMKMENELRAPCSGTIKELKVHVGESVEANQTLAIIE